MKLGKKGKDGLYTGVIETVGDALVIVKNELKKIKEANK